MNRKRILLLLLWEGTRGEHVFFGISRSPKKAQTKGFFFLILAPRYSLPYLPI